MALAPLPSFLEDPHARDNVLEVFEAIGGKRWLWSRPPPWSYDGSRSGAVYGDSRTAERRGEIRKKHCFRVIDSSTPRMAPSGRAKSNQGPVLGRWKSSLRGVYRLPTL